MRKNNNNGARYLPKQKNTKLVFFVGALILSVLIVSLFLRSSTQGRVHSAQDAIDLLESRADDYGYENALSELEAVSSLEVEGNSYYRLLQNYHGIPVYGRTVVYVADKHGNELSISGNILDIPNDLSVKPTYTEDRAKESVYSYLQEQGIPVDRTAEDMEAELCIYFMDDQAHLTWMLHGNSLYLVDAHSGEVFMRQSFMDNASYTPCEFSDGQQFTGIKDGSKYILKNVDRGIYIYDAGRQTYFDPDTGATAKGVPKLITSKTNVFSFPRFQIVMNLVCDIEDYFTGVIRDPGLSTMLLICDDQMGSYNSRNAGASWMKLTNAVKTKPVDYDKNWNNGYVGLMTVGTWYVDNAMQQKDILGHEFTHILFNRYVQPDKIQTATGAINEGVADIFGELFEAYHNGNIAPDWNSSSGRTMYDPSVHLYPENITESQSWRSGGFRVLDASGNPTTSDVKHGYSTMISHAAYRMWNGIDGDPQKKLSNEELGKLWYRTMLMLDSTASFADCRTLALQVSESMSLTPMQRLCIREAFDLAEFPYCVNTDFLLHVDDIEGNRMDTYSLLVRDRQGAKPDTIFPVLNMESPNLSLDPGSYEATLTCPECPGWSTTFLLDVESCMNRVMYLPTDYTQKEEPTEPLPSTQEPHTTTPTVEGTQDPVDYEIIRWDRSVTKESGHTFDYYYDYVVFNGGSESCRRIGEDQYRATEEYMTELSQEMLEKPLIDAFGFASSGFWTAATEVTHNGDGIFSTVTRSKKFSGGNATDRNNIGRTYSLQTGELLELTDLFDEDPQTLLNRMREKIWEEISDDLPFDNAWDTLNSMDFDDFEFWIRDGEVILWVRQYLLVAGVHGPVTVSTGIRLGENPVSVNAGNTSSAIRGTEGPVEYDYENINRSHKINYDDNTIYYTNYPVLSGGAAGIGVINQDLYRIADAFMHEKTQADIEEPHYAFGMQFHYSHTQFFNVTHNGDGIISFAIGVDGFWGDMEKRDYSISYGRTYNLSTGTVMSITDLIDMAPDAVERVIKDKAAEYFRNRIAPDGTETVIAACALEDIPFWIRDGELIVAFYDDPQTPDETYSFGTGIYIS